MSTKIEWTNETWNPTTGCTKVSPGCDRCYIERTPPFRMKGRTFDQPGTGGTTGVLLHPDRLDMPLHWRRPRRVFVNSLSDLFHKEIPNRYVARVFAVMAATPEHTYQVLTKRHDRMRSLLSDEYFPEMVDDAMGEYTHAPVEQWPLPNVWLGVSVEDQKRGDLRIPALLETPAAVRFLSCEPLLGPLELPQEALRSGSIGWCIVGGESGPRARPMHPNWARSVRDQCLEAHVPFFYKQTGEWATAPSSYGPAVPPHVRRRTQLVFAYGGDVDGQIMLRVGKHNAGRMLDGRTWDEFPAVSA